MDKETIGEDNMHEKLNTIIEYDPDADALVVHTKPGARIDKDIVLDNYVILSYTPEGELAQI